MNIPNTITLIRIGLVPVFIVFMNLDMLSGQGSLWRIAAIGVFIIAGSTDWLDGYLAWKRNEVTSLGKFMDPLADKLLVSAALLYFVAEGIMPVWLAFVILAREFIVSSLRMVAASDDGTVIAAGFSGKVKTLTQILLCIVMLTPLYAFAPDILGGYRLCDICSWLMLAVTLWSGGDYLWRFRGVLKSGLK